MLFDTHCHLTDPAFRDDLEEVLARAEAAGVRRLVTIASTPADTEDALTRVADGVRAWTTAGFHPHEASGWSESEGERIRQLASDPRVVALGECGLDYHYDHSPRPVQRKVFDAHVEIASETGLPLVVHSRSADADTAAVLRSLPAGVRGVLHCFGGSGELLDAALPAGWYVSVTGLVTFRRFDGGDWLRAIPEDRLMVETDAPYMAPVPDRGKRNEPAWVARVAEAVAHHRAQSLQDVERYTTANAARFYGLEAPGERVALPTRAQGTAREDFG
jgi:TatD DNase family protein